MKTIKLNKLSKSLLAASLLCVVALPTAAQRHHNNGHYNSYRNHSAFDYARVVDVQPIYKAYQVNNPVERCYEERVPVESHGNRRNKNTSYTNEIIGGVVGAAVGNQIGKSGRGNTREVATVVGAVVGASLAHGLERGNNSRHNDRVRYETVEHCEIHDSYTTERKLIGYDVAYRYKGQIHHTQSDQHPGKRIKVKVSHHRA